MQRRWLRIAIGAAVAALCLVFAQRVQFDGDIGRLLPDSDPQLRKTSAVAGQALQRMVIDLGLPEGEVDRLDLLISAAEELASELRESPNVKRAKAAMLDDEALEFTDLLVDSAPRVLSPDHYEELSRRLEPEAIHDSLETLKRRAHEPDSGWILSEALRDPLGISGLVLAPMESMLAGFQDVRLIRGYMTTQDGSHLLMFVEPSVAATDTEGSLSVLQDLDRALAKLHEREEFRQLTLRHLGAHRSTLDNQDSIERDVIFTSLLGGLFVALIAILTLARYWWGLLAMAPAVFGGLVALGVISFWRDSVAAPVVGFGVALLGISIDYSIHVLYRLDSGGDKRLPVRALFMGATTTAFAFLALGVSSMPALREVGLLGAIGIVASATFAVFVLPALAGSAGERKRARFDLRRILAAFPVRGQRSVLIGSVLLTLFLALGIQRLDFDGDISRLSSLSEEAALDEAGIKQTWGEAFRTAQVVVAGEDFQEALAINERLREQLEALKAKGDVRDFGSVSSLLPTLSVQEERLEAWREFWSTERVERARADLEEACEELGFNIAAFAPFFEWIDSAPPALVYAPGDEGPIASMLRDRVIPMGAETLIATPVFVANWSQVEALQTAVKDSQPEAVVISNEAMSRRLAELVVGELWKLGVCAFLTVVLLVFLWLRSLRHTLLVIVPLLVSSLWTLGALGWLGIPINLANSVFAGFLFGIAVDYAIFMVHARVDVANGGSEDVPETDTSVLLCAITTCIGFGALTAAEHPVLFSIGATALTGILASFFATRIFVPWMAGRILEPTAPHAERP